MFGINDAVCTVNSSVIIYAVYTATEQINAALQRTSCKDMINHDQVGDVFEDELSSLSILSMIVGAGRCN